MDNITKGDPIKADWANALTNALNAATHGKTSMRGGGGQNVSIAPYQRGSRPLAFDLVEITDDAEASLSGKVSGGLLLNAYKEEQDTDNEEEKKILLKNEDIEISEYEASFKAGEKVWVHVTYDTDTWEAYTAILEKGNEVPEPEDGEAYIVVGEFEERDKSIIYKHKGITFINWDVIKWEFKKYKLKTDPLCALELKEVEEENELTLNIESSSEEENIDADSNLKVWLVQKKGKGQGGAEEGPVRLGVRIKDERPDYTGQDPIEITGRSVSLKLDQTEHETSNGIKYSLEVKNGELAMKLDTDSMTEPEQISYTAEAPIEIAGSTIKLNVNTTQKTSNGIKYQLTKTGGQLDISLNADSLAVGENLKFEKPLRKTSSGYVVFDYDRNWSEPANGVKAHVVMVGDALSVELHADTTSDGSDGLISDSWTVLACDSDHALRLKRNDNEKIYIQQGEWNKSSNQYEPIN